ncbi:MAG: bifunctional DNA-formamidopyrimidine glycosylase/DNA-(apurinic or apyrimidinic site) lyase [Gammaproteobacteria bacterium]|nr:bifunctional DNA-formamidopyrimidine glycosylase/DNA-(apurinic or apyrimidinic site) lyase [Gammaproteobacteria bacterium]
MPELPEVETTRRGIARHSVGKTVARVVVRDARLRWPVPRTLGRRLPGQLIEAVERRGKYLLLRSRAGTLIMHLGMSGSLHVLPASTPAQKHDHLDIVFTDHTCLRLRDPRRFGAALWTERDPLTHPLLSLLGPEPLGEDFNAAYIHRRARGRRTAIKQFIMDSRMVVGVGNIYASEALFAAGIHPARATGRVSLERCERLVCSIRDVLRKAIAQGGTTLRDFRSSDGTPGYFQQQLAVYGRDGLPCPACGHPVRQLRQGQRATYYCARCQR